MKRALDRLIGLIVAGIAVTTGFAIAADLLRPYMQWIAIALVTMLAVVTLVIVAPTVERWVDRVRANRSDDWLD